ncbi:unnamed protein product [Psylliodes chrysocephalus]|uniref:Uncharacterized protein n=1 Tax=Psylliodes chrysocephalus TaxID=3402493 RepID=A0A9P0GEM2_9CUCU|nr:unnamed protein product [Psylliodes chrysocephala]
MSRKLKINKINSDQAYALLDDIPSEGCDASDVEFCDNDVDWLKDLEEEDSVEKEDGIEEQDHIKEEDSIEEKQERNRANLEELCSLNDETIAVAHIGNIIQFYIKKIFI